MSIVRISQRIGQVGVLSGLLVGLVATTTPGTVGLSSGEDVSLVRKLTESWPVVPQEKTSSDSSQLPDSLVDNPSASGALGNFGTPTLGEGAGGIGGINSGGAFGPSTGGFGPSTGGFGPSNGFDGGPGLVGDGGSIGGGGGIGGDTGSGEIDASPLPGLAKQAYVLSAAAVSDRYQECHLQWQVVAGIGLVESNHGRFGNRVADNAGTITPAIIGPQLNGTNNTKVIRDTDQGRLDGDREFDRAVGPMQFIPETWARIGQDGNSDGKKDPNNLFDAAHGTAWYLCSHGQDLADPANLRKALLRYNASSAYVAKVLSAAKQYGAVGPGFESGDGLKPNPGGIGDGLKPSDPKPGDGFRPTPGEGDKPKPDEGIKPTPGEGDKPKPDQPNPGEGDKPKPDEGIKPTPGEGDKPKPDEGIKPTPGDGGKPKPDQPNPGVGAGKPDPVIPD